METYVTIVEYDFAGSMAGIIAYAGSSREAAKAAGRQKEAEFAQQHPLCIVQIWDNGNIAQTLTLKDLT